MSGRSLPRGLPGPAEPKETGSLSDGQVRPGETGMVPHPAGGGAGNRARPSKRPKLSNRRAVVSSSQEEFTLRPWHEVARLYTQRTGEPITRGGAWVIGQRAIRKLRELLAQEFDDDGRRAIAQALTPTGRR